MIPWLGNEHSFPHIETALAEPNGLLAVGGDLHPERLLAAYRLGIFPWCSAGQPLLWWSPDPRMVLYVEEFQLRRSLAKVVRRNRFEVRVDTAFRDVMVGCAMAPGRGPEQTWISPDMVIAYTALHARGFAHSVEAWCEGQLAGGLYGVAIGRMFFGESMFSLTPNASKVAFVHLIGILRARGYPLVDCQQETAHLASFGARPIRRYVFAQELATLVQACTPEGPWLPLLMSSDLLA
jgi:leucyl/phenylalanyl-tRNA--protein transferase